MGTKRQPNGATPEDELHKAQAVIAGYREAVARLIESKFDWALTAAHLARRRHSAEYVSHCEFLVRELRARLENFRAIEPEHFGRTWERLREEFVRRDARNIHLSGEDRDGEKE